MNKEKTQYRILIVEDEAAIRDMLQLNLEMEGYNVVVAPDGPTALSMARTHRLNLILLDVMIPGVDGFSVCNTLRLEGNQTPIMFLSAKNTPEERVEGLKLGADDYLGKPFNLEELLIRITKLISRKDNEQETLADLTEYKFEGGKINFKTFEVVTYDGTSKVLSKKEIMLLKMLIQREGQVTSREEILESIWGYDVFPSTRTIDNYILAFRKYFEPNPREPKHFFSVRGVGYRFVE